MEIKIMVDIPAIDKLADALAKMSIPSASASEALKRMVADVTKAHEEPVAPVKLGDPDGSVAESTTTAEKPTETLPGYVEVPVETVPAELTNEPKPEPITLERIMKTTAQMRDDGLMPQLRSLIGANGPYGIRMVSQLKPEQYDAFAADLRKLGGKI